MLCRNLYGCFKSVHISKPLPHWFESISHCETCVVQISVKFSISLLCWLKDLFCACTVQGLGWGSYRFLHRILESFLWFSPLQEPSLFITGFQQFDHGITYSGFLHAFFFLLEILWASRFYGVLIFIKYENFGLIFSLLFWDFSCNLVRKLVVCSVFFSFSLLSVFSFVEFYRFVCVHWSFLLWY